MMENKFTPRAEEALRLAQEAAEDMGHGYVGSEHLLLGLLREEEGIAHRVLEENGLTDEMVCDILHRSVGTGVSGAAPSQGLTPRAKSAVELAVSEAARTGAGYIGTEHLLMGLLREGNNMALRILRTVGIDPKKLYSAVVKKLNEAPRTAAVSGSASAPAQEGGKKGTLEEYTRDLTEAARSGKLAPVIGREKEIQKELKKLKNLKQTNIPKALAYVSGELFEQYIHDMKIVQHFAMLNRQAMMDEIVKGMKLHVEEQFTTIHNYIDTDAMILRKGAVSAKEGERLLIPINMRDGSLLCVGKGNEDWNCSAPHGAGRLMSRADAKQSFTVSEFKKQMAEVYTTSVSKATLDECPMAYKGMQDILDNIGPTADVVKVIRPIYNFKAGDEE